MDLTAQFANPGLQSAYEIARGVFIILDGALLILFIFSFIKSVPFRPKIHPEHGAHKKAFTLQDALLKERWDAVMKKMEAGSKDSLGLAVIEADKIVDDALTQLGLEGEHMADRLEQLSEDDVRALPRLWRAHRVRNNLVHTPGYELTPEQVKIVIADCEAFLKEIKLLA